MIIENPTYHVPILEEIFINSTTDNINLTIFKINHFLDILVKTS